MFSSLFIRLQKIVLHKILSYPLHVRFISCNSATQNSFTISYLINTCGLSAEKATSAAKYVHFESSTNPDSVLTLFRNNGFSTSQITKIMSGRPSLLMSSVDKTLKPKIDFFNSKGVRGSDLANTLCFHPQVLTASLEKRIIPGFDFLTSIVPTDDMVKFLQRGVYFLRYDPEKELAPNISILRAHGVPEGHIVKLLVSQPRVFWRSTTGFRELVEKVKKMEIDISQYTFLVAIHALSSMTKLSLEAKFDVYRRWGWSDEDLLCAMKKKPYVITHSEKKIMSIMDFLVNKMGYHPSFIAKQPHVLAFSLERRIVPRCSVVEALITSGLVDEFPKLVGLLNMPEDEFLKKFVTKFEKRVPVLVNLCQGKKGEMV